MTRVLSRLFARRKSPELLYKYYGPERSDVFRTFQVRFSQLAALNDPFEFFVEINLGLFRRATRGIVWRSANPIQFSWMAQKQIFSILFLEGDLVTRVPFAIRALIYVPLVLLGAVLVLALYPLAIKHMSRIMGAAADEFESVLTEEARRGLIVIFSCSETWQSVPMWAHYAANHTGFAFGFEPQRAFPKSNRNGEPDGYLPAQRVRYQDKAPKLTARTLNDASSFLTTKLSHWSYEREWRFSQTPDGAAARGSFHNGNEIALFNLEPNSLGSGLIGVQARR